MRPERKNMKGYIKITAEVNGKIQSIGAEACIRMSQSMEDLAMLVQTLCDAIHIDTGDRRTMRKLLRAMRRLKTANPPAQPEGEVDTETRNSADAGDAPAVELWSGEMLPTDSTEAQE